MTKSKEGSERVSKPKNAKISEALKGNKRALGNKGGGRPSSYKPEYAVWAEKMAKLGATDAELADAFDVSEMTIGRWKLEHPEFSFALKTGKDFADAEVASKLFARATGYSHPEDDIKMYNGEIIITPTTKHYPPDTAAAIFWLKNRQRAKWRDKFETEVTGKDGKDLVPEAKGVLVVPGVLSEGDWEKMVNKGGE